MQVVRKLDGQPIPGAKVSLGLPIWCIGDFDSMTADSEGFISLSTYHQTQGIRVTVGNDRSVHRFSEIKAAGNKIIVESW
jgi:hypothetical protein